MPDGREAQRPTVATSEYEDARLAPLGGPAEDAEACWEYEIGSFDVQLR